MTASFGFSKLRIFGKEVYFWLMLAALTLPEVILLSPLFVTATQLHLYNTLTAVVLPLAALQLPFVILLTRNYFDGIPTELIDAGRIDGASVVQTFWHIVLPLTKPIASAVVVLTLINSWNSYLLPLVFLIRPGIDIEDDGLVLCYRLTELAAGRSTIFGVLEEARTPSEATQRGESLLAVLQKHHTNCLHELEEESEDTQNKGEYDLVAPEELREVRALVHRIETFQREAET